MTRTRTGHSFSVFLGSLQITLDIRASVFLGHVAYPVGVGFWLSSGYFATPPELTVKLGLKFHDECTNRVLAPLQWVQVLRVR